MNSEAHGGETKGAVKVEWHRVGENLWRLGESGRYYAFLKQGDKQFRRSLKTNDRKLAERRLAELRSQVETLKTGAETRQTFLEVAQRWMDVTAHTLKASSAERRDLCIRSLVPFFEGLPIRNIQAHHCERWLTERGRHLAPMTMNRELELMKNVFAYAIKNGLILRSPAEDLQRRKVVQAKITIPTIEHFRPKTKFPLVAYKWDNLYFCCMYCQQKFNDFSEDALQPDASDYTFERYFLWDHTTGELKANPAANAEDQRRAIASINLYKLNIDHPRLRKLAFRRRIQFLDEPLDELSYRSYLESIK